MCLPACAACVTILRQQLETLHLAGPGCCHHKAAHHQMLVSALRCCCRGQRAVGILSLLLTTANAYHGHFISPTQDGRHDHRRRHELNIATALYLSTCRPTTTALAAESGGGKGWGEMNGRVGDGWEHMEEEVRLPSC